MKGVTRACLYVLFASVVGGCNSLLGIGKPHAAEDAGVKADSSTGPDAGTCVFDLSHFDDGCTFQ